MNVLVETEGFQAVDANRLEAAVLHALAAEGRTVLELSLTLLGDEDIQALNREYLGHDRPTDVIAFGLGGPEDLVGDVYLGVEQARRQAEEHGVPLDEELVRLAVHGTLHVLGHDHPDGDERWQSPMFEVQERIVLAFLGEPGA